MDQPNGTFEQDQLELDLEISDAWLPPAWSEHSVLNPAAVAQPTAGTLQDQRRAEGRCIKCGTLREMTYKGLDDCKVCK